MIVGSFPNLPTRELALPSLPAIAPQADAEPAALTGGSQGASFSKFLQQAVNDVDGKLKTANEEQIKVLSGETNNLHQAVIAMQEAGVAFSLMVEVRNKLVDSYQELMRMQV